MFDQWGLSSWGILLVDLLAIVIIVIFLKRKIQSKLKEVESRQEFHLQKRKSERLEKKDI
ncbi:MAG TPA: hypothetical protein QGI72_02730 [Poseidonia sp.]|nr:hypothetical protein [Poseidonia sp.]